MRIAIITESFPPDVNGVANCVVRVAENLVRKGHHPLVIAPESAYDTAEAAPPHPPARYRDGPPGQPGRPRRVGQPGGQGDGPADGGRVPDRPAELRPRVPPGPAH